MRVLTAISWFLFLAVAENLCQAASIQKSMPKESNEKTEHKTTDQNQTIQRSSANKPQSSSESAQFKSNSLEKDDIRKQKRDESEFQKVSGIQYTPLDLAQYIVRTRDEEGVALAIEELLREGLLDREEAILYLEDVKKELANLKAQQNLKQMQQQQQKKLDLQQNNKKQAIEDNRRVHEKPAHQQTPKQRPIAQSHVSPNRYVVPENHENKDQTIQLTPAVVKSKANNKTVESSTTTGQSKKKENKKNEKEPSNALYEEYLLQNVIYQLAKDMFSQSMMRDDESAEQLLSRFASFLESELEDKKFSKESQEKILDTVSSALIESLRERLYMEN